MKLSNIILFSVFCLIINTESPAQVDLFNWRSYTSQMTISDIELAGDNLYAATTGGLSIYNFANKNFDLINSLNGLWDTDLTALYYDPGSDILYCGSSSGALVLVDKSLKTQISLEIQKSSFNNKAITGFSRFENLLCISTEFGLTIYDLQKSIFTETILKFGSYSTNAAANASFIDEGRLFIATDEGIAIAEINKQIADPDSWQNLFIEVQGFRQKFKYFTKAGNKIYAASLNTIYEVRTDTLIKIADENSTILNLTSKSGEAYYCTSSGLYTISGEIIETGAKFPLSRIEYFDSNLPSGQFDSENPIIVYQNFGMAFTQSGKFVTILPNSPITNYFKKINIDNNGNLLAATDRYTSRGCMFFDGTDWQNFYPELTPGIMTNGIVSAMQAGSGKYYLGTWGVGAIELDLAGSEPTFSQISNHNSPMSPFSNDFTIISNIREEKNGTLWMVNYGESTPGNLLVAMDMDGNYFGFENCEKPFGRYYQAIAIDGSGTKWVGSTLSDGLFYFNENQTLDNPADDICGLIQLSSFPNLLANQQNCLAVDNNDILWIGTPYGLASIYNPSAVLYGQNPIVRSIKNLSQQKVNDIYVDAVDNKWLATNEGVWILSSDASEILHIINQDNSPLPTNIINSITGDLNSGTIYFGTDFGLFSVSTMNVKPTKDYSLKCFPQPFVIPEDQSLLIDGLAVNSEVFITTVSGSLIRKLSTFSRRIVWDGRDEFGNLVAAGIYLVSAQSRTEGNSAVQKIAVVRSN